MARVRRLFVGATALLAVTALAACGAQEGSAGGDAAVQDVTIGFVPGIASDPFFVAMQQGAEEHAEELGIKLIWQGAPDEYSPQSQVPFVETMITQQVDGLILVPTDPDALQASVVSATSAEIPVVTVDTTVTDQSDLVSHITGDNVDGGRMAGETLAEQIGGEGKVFLMSGSPTATTNTLREQGFREALEEFPNIELLGVEYANSQPAEATSAVSTILLEHPDLAGIFAVDGTSGTGTVAALRNAGAVGEVALVGYDAYDNQVADLQDGAYTALVVQKPGEMAALAIDSIMAAIDGDTSSVDQEVVMENVVMTKENFDETGRYQYPN